MAFLKRFWDRQGLKYKLLLITIPSSIFSSMLIMFLAYHIFGRYEEKMYYMAQQNLRLMVTKIENELSEAESFGVDLVTDSTIQKALKSDQTNIRTRQVSMDYIRMAQQVYKVLQNGLAKNKNLISISIFVEDEWYYVGNAKRSYDASLLEKIKFDQQQNQTEMLWCAPQYPTSRLYGIRLIRDIYHGTFQKEGVLVLEYDLKGSLNHMRQGSRDASFVQEFAIYDGEQVIYSDISPESKMEWRKDRGYEIIQADSRRYFAARLEESLYGWTYVFLVNYDDLFGAIRFIKYFFCACAVCMVIAATVYCQKLSRLITSRFSWLLGRINQVKRGCFSVEWTGTENGQDELGVVCQQFEDMVAALEQLIQDNYVKQMLIKENQLKVLQNQINPHFLFNTLQSINWKAKENHEEEISQITEALGRLLRYTLKNDRDPVELTKELQVLKSYLYIQQVRYGDRLTVHMDIPEDMGVQMLPKLSLQNIVENSIKHGLENMLEPCVITIRAGYTKDGYQVSVEDNGPGIKKSIKEGDEEDRGTGAGQGIGLKNIQERLKLLFKEGSGLTIEDTGHGTLTTIRIWEQEEGTEDRATEIKGMNDGEGKKESNTGG